MITGSRVLRMIHILECLVVFYPVLWVLFLLRERRLKRTWRNSIANIAFEREINSILHVLGGDNFFLWWERYLSKRPLFSWVLYVKNRGITWM